MLIGREHQSQIVQRVAIECKKLNFNPLTSKSRKHNKQNGCVIHWITSSFTKTPPGLEFTLFFSSITQRCKHTKYNRGDLSQKLDSTVTKAAKRAKSRKSMFYRVFSQINFTLLIQLWGHKYIHINKKHAWYNDKYCNSSNWQLLVDITIALVFQTHRTLSFWL